MRRLWRALTRRRGLRHGRGRRSGIALLVVVSTIMILTVLVTELTYGARVRFLVSTHQRDRTEAYWLARSGYNLYRLILSANKELEKNSSLSEMADMFGVNLGDALWQMIPVLNTGLIRMLLGNGGSMSGLDEEEVQDFEKTGKVSDEAEQKSREGGLFADRNFLDFDGDFSAEVKDHESRINVNFFAEEGEVTSLQESPTAMMLYNLMSGEENDQWFHERNIDRWEIIGNLKDWVDADTYRSGGLGGYEDSLYNVQDPPYLSKNAPFDTIDEIRMVAGWEDEVFDRFGENLTVYGKSRKVNVNTASDLMLMSVIRAAATTRPTDSDLELCFSQQAFSFVRQTWGKPQEFADNMQEFCGIEMDVDTLKSMITTSSHTFTIESTGLVGTSAVTIDAVLDFNESTTGELKYWRVD